MKPSDLLNKEELEYIKEICTIFNAQSVEIDGTKFVNLPLSQWRRQYDVQESLPH